MLKEKIYKLKKFICLNIIDKYFDKILRQKSYKQASIIHPKTFNIYKNKYKNKNVVIVGCGPSVKFYKNFDNAIHIGVNRAFLIKDINLDYLFVQDYLKGQNNMQLANEYNYESCTKFYGKIGNNKSFYLYPNVKKIHKKDIIKARAKTYILEDSFDSSLEKNIEIEPFADSGGCVFSALQFALFTNPKTIYLVGCDCSDQGHFHEEVFKDASIKSYDLTNQYPFWLKFKQYLDDINCQTEIISVNPIGLKGLFKDIYTENFSDKIKE